MALKECREPVLKNVDSNQKHHLKTQWPHKGPTPLGAVLDEPHARGRPKKGNKMTLTPKLISTPPAFSASMQLSPDGMKIAARGALLLCVVTGVISGVLPGIRL